MNTNDGVTAFTSRLGTVIGPDGILWMIEISTSYPKGNGTNGKNNADWRYKKPTLIEGVQYHPGEDGNG
ncbi:MAG TPA: hypothetical protein VK772_10985 [Puia sp.]|nr:hypothetical protein [Puia sp.]